LSSNYIEVERYEAEMLSSLAALIDGFIGLLLFLLIDIF